MQINDILIVTAASFGFYVGQEVSVLEVREGGALVGDSDFSNFVSFETVEVKQ